jgi:leader peptidase (prepilin peptidase) / N-methyltransferase
MNLALAAVVAAPGLVVGSFLNVVASRVPERRGIVLDRSACMTCNTQIAAWDNVPLLSYLLLRGRCRSCKAAIPMRYPAVEALTALLIVACVLRFGLTAEAAVAAFFCSVLVALSAIDIEHRIVPNRIVMPSFVVVLVAQTAIAPSPEWALGAVAASGFLLAAALAYPSGMGMGDVKLALLLGAMLGRNVAVGLMLGLLFALVPAAILALRHGARARKMALPFAPFLALGAVVALFAGEPILDWYLGILR